MASNDESHIDQTLHVQFELLLGSIFIRAIQISPSRENQVKEVLDRNVDKSYRPHFFYPTNFVAIVRNIRFLSFDHFGP